MVCQCGVRDRAAVEQQWLMRLSLLADTGLLSWGDTVLLDWWRHAHKQAAPDWLLLLLPPQVDQP